MKSHDTSLWFGAPKIGYEHYLPRFKNNSRGALGLDYVGGEIQNASQISKDMRFNNSIFSAKDARHMHQKKDNFFH